MLELPTVSPWRTSTSRTGLAIASGFRLRGVVERVEHQAGQQLGIKVGRLLGHHGARVADRLDVAYRRRIHQEDAAGGGRADVTERTKGIDSVFDESARLDLLGRDLKDALQHQSVQDAYVEPLHGWRSPRHRVSQRARILEPQEPQLDSFAAERDRDRALPRFRQRRAHHVGAAELLDREQWRDPRIEGRYRLWIEAPRHTIRWQDHEPRIVAGDQRHHRVVVGPRGG